MISIVTVTYNAASTIERTLQSVALQSCRDYEHIIIDGASKDSTIEIAKSFGYQELSAADGSRPEGAKVYISEPDKGLYDAMNKAFGLAKGDYICFLNAGDKLHSADTLQHIADAGDRENVGVIYGDTDIVDGDGNRLRGRRLTPPEVLTWKSFREGMLVCHQSFYINREIALPYDLAYRFSADFDWCIRCMKEGEKRGLKTNRYVHEVLTDYLSEGMTTANHKASLKERFRIMAKHYGLITTICQHIWFVLRAIIKK